VLELLALPVSYSLGFQAGLMVYGAPILLSALAVLYLLFIAGPRGARSRAREVGAADISVRSRARLRATSRDTCICDTPMISRSRSATCPR